MNLISFPTGTDIYIEINGKKVAVAQSYKAKTTKESRYIEAFGSSQPVGTAGGRVKHIVQLTRVCAANAAGSINFHELSGFNLVIVRPHSKVIYSGCQWAEIQESTQMGEVIFETVSIIAAQRMEVEQ